MKKLNIDLEERSYDILIGRNILSKVGKFISERFKPSKITIITHPSIRNLFGDKMAVVYTRVVRNSAKKGFN